MSRNIKVPSRRSLASIGIPNHRDALAVYFRWVRQRYYRAQSVMGPDLGPSSTYNGDHEREMQFDAERLSVDLMGVGMGFEGVGLSGYPGEVVL
ncbi:hypothetical protein BDW02DRAFT_571730, partial [Decorospora gaudefroyi]